jgi:hypothetical protein
MADGLGLVSAFFEQLTPQQRREVIMTMHRLPTVYQWFDAQELRYMAEGMRALAESGKPGPIVVRPAGVRGEPMGVQPGERVLPDGEQMRTLQTYRVGPRGEVIVPVEKTEGTSATGLETDAERWSRQALYHGTMVEG